MAPKNAKQENNVVEEKQTHIDQTEIMGKLVELYKNNKFGTKEWNDLLLLLLEDDEIELGIYPRIGGLRRIFHLFGYDLLTINFDNIQMHCNDSMPIYVVVKCDIVYSAKNSLFYNEDKSWRDTKSISDIGDASIQNTHGQYSAYLGPIAATRAEARALKKILGIKTVTAEEISNQIDQDKEQSDNDTEQEERITPEQINLIDFKCKQLDVNPNKLLEGVTDVTKASKTDGAKIIRLITQLWADRSKITKEMRGYSSTWKEKN